MGKKEVGTKKWVKWVKIWKKPSENGFFLDSNLSFTIRVFTWGLANDLYICIKNVYQKPAKHVSLV